MAKAIERFPSSSPRRPRCSQDGLLEPTWAPKRLPRRSKNTQKGRVFLLFFRFLVPNAPKCPPGRPRQRNLKQKEPPRPPQTPSGPWFYYNFRRFWWHFERIFVMLCFPLFSFALLCFSLLYWINNQSPALSKQCLHTPTTFSKQCFFTGTVAGDAKHLGNHIDIDIDIDIVIHMNNHMNIDFMNKSTRY